MYVILNSPSTFKSSPMWIGLEVMFLFSQQSGFI